MRPPLIICSVLLWTTLAQAATLADFEVYEGSDARVGWTGFITTQGIETKAATLKCQVYDDATGTLLWDPAEWTVNSKTFAITIPHTENVVVQKGFCQDGTGVCSDTAPCASNVPCSFVDRELHTLTCAWVGASGGHGTWPIQFAVLPLRALPFRTPTPGP